MSDFANIASFIRMVIEISSSAMTGRKGKQKGEGLEGQKEGGNERRRQGWTDMNWDAMWSDNH